MYKHKQNNPTVICQYSWKYIAMNIFSWSVLGEYADQTVTERVQFVYKLKPRKASYSTGIGPNFS